MDALSLTLEMEERMKKTLYYGEYDITRPSFPLTNLAVDVCRHSTNRQLDQIDLDQASALGRHASVSPCQMVVSMMYMRRLKKQGSSDYLQTVSSSQIFLLSMMMASKYLHDQGTDEEIFNDEWADFAGIEVADVNKAEFDFLKNLDWHLYVQPSEFFDFLADVERCIAFGEGFDRGWFTYTDLSTVLHHDLVLPMTIQLVQALKVLVTCSVTYLAGVASLYSLVNVPPLIHQPMVAFLSNNQPIVELSHDTNVFKDLTYSRFWSYNDGDCPTGGGADFCAAMSQVAALSSDETMKNILDKTNGFTEHENCNYTNESGGKYFKKQVFADSNNPVNSDVLFDGFTGVDKSLPPNIVAWKCDKTDDELSFYSRSVLVRAIEHSLIALVFAFDSDAKNLQVHESNDKYNQDPTFWTMCRRCREMLKRYNGLKQDGFRMRKIIDGHTGLVEKMYAEKLIEACNWHKKKSCFHSADNKAEVNDCFGCLSFGNRDYHFVNSDHVNWSRNFGTHERDSADSVPVIKYLEASQSASLKISCHRNETYTFFTSVMSF